eukprot:1176250-Prorocentrum_minimum.AAC.2
MTRAFPPVRGGFKLRGGGFRLRGEHIVLQRPNSVVWRKATGLKERPPYAIRSICAKTMEIHT